MARQVSTLNRKQREALPPRRPCCRTSMSAECARTRPTLVHESVSTEEQSRWSCAAAARQPRRLSGWSVGPQRAWPCALPPIIMPTRMERRRNGGHGMLGLVIATDANAPTMRLQGIPRCADSLGRGLALVLRQTGHPNSARDRLTGVPSSLGPTSTGFGDGVSRLGFSLTGWQDTPSAAAP